jgi:hypothetical protein
MYQFSKSARAAGGHSYVCFYQADRPPHPNHGRLAVLWTFANPRISTIDPRAVYFDLITAQRDHGWIPLVRSAPITIGTPVSHVDELLIQGLDNAPLAAIDRAWIFAASEGHILLPFRRWALTHKNLDAMIKAVLKDMVVR